MSFDNLDVTPLFGKLRPAPDPKPLPPTTNLDLSVRTGLDFYITDKISCTPGDEEVTVLLLAERVINMIRARKGLDGTRLFAADAFTDDPEHDTTGDTTEDTTEDSPSRAGDVA